MLSTKVANGKEQGVCVLSTKVANCNERVKKQPISHNYKLSQSQLERVANHKDLGIFIDSKLTFVPHVDYIVAKANRTLGVCWHHCRNLDPKTKKILYYSC